MRKVGVLTGGGDCPGLNPALRAIARMAESFGFEVIGFRGGWKGILKNQTQSFTFRDVDELLTAGGTFLGTSRTNPYKETDGPKLVRKSMQENGLEALIAIGGEDTLGVANKLSAEGVPVVGLPKTIDNDLDATDVTIGFPTAVEIVTEAFDRIRTTARSHDRIMIVEVMGRHAGWLTAYGAIAGGADLLLVPEFPMKLREVLNAIEAVRKRGKNYVLVAVAEGAKIVDDSGKEIGSQSEEAVDAFGHVALGGIGELLASLIKKETGQDPRVTVLGHTQRGGNPSAFDRILGTALGVKAMELVRDKQYGKMPSLKGGKIVVLPLAEAVGRLKTLTPELYQLARHFVG